LFNAVSFKIVLKAAALSATAAPDADGDTPQVRIAPLPVPPSRARKEMILPGGRNSLPRRLSHAVILAIAVPSHGCETFEVENMPTRRRSPGSSNSTTPTSVGSASLRSLGTDSSRDALMKTRHRIWSTETDLEILRFVFGFQTPRPSGAPQMPRVRALFAQNIKCVQRQRLAGWVPGYV
jgi:hypothetical protein